MIDPTDPLDSPQLTRDRQFALASQRRFERRLLRFLALVALFLLAVLASNRAFGQSAPATRPPSGVPATAFETLSCDATNCDGVLAIEYLCTAFPRQSQQTIFHRTAASSRAPMGGTATNLTSIAVSTNTATATTSAAHGLRPGQWVTAAGATVDTDLNGSYKILTVATTTTFTFTTASVADATYNEATLSLSTYDTRDSQRVWAIQKLYIGATGVAATFRTTWARLSATDSPSSSMKFACSARTTYF